jgi:hypothetical protein
MLVLFSVLLDELKPEMAKFLEARKLVEEYSR